MERFDLFVIGGGSGGVRSARFAAQRGLKVAIAESGRWGGTCVNVGCVPKKLYAHAGHLAGLFHDARGFGWHLESPRHDWAALHEAVDRYILRLNGIYGRLLDGVEAHRIEGRARICGPHEVEVNGQRYQAEKILIATGGRPAFPAELPGVELAESSDDFFARRSAPASALVIGGGYIGVELASTLHHLGVETTLAYRGELILRGFDHDLRRHLSEQLQGGGLAVRYGCTPTKVEALEDGRRRVHLSDGSQLEVELLLFATGRTPNIEGLGLEPLGVELGSRGEVRVNEHFQSSVPSIYALGDVIDRVQLTPVALAEASRLAAHLAGEETTPLDYDLIPTAVFAHPAAATVGLSEEAARAKGHRLRIYLSTFRPLHHGPPDNPGRALVKLVVDQERDRVLGVHFVGPEAGEVIQGFAVALRAGATKADFDLTLGIHPTMAEEFVTLRTVTRED
ncbi:MAG: glutathione-disulfide reductase [Myxococcota bacterium]|nr:glutathione-disulfide reductase [Myxococcota bacterium]